MTRSVAMPIVSVYAAELAHIACPRHRRKLVHRGDEKTGQPSIDGLVHGHDRQWLVMVAMTIDTRRAGPLASSGLGRRRNDAALNRAAPGAIFSGIGDGCGRRSGRRSYGRGLSHCCHRLSPITFGVAALPTHSQSRRAMGRASRRPVAVRVPGHISASRHGSVDRGSAVAGYNASTRSGPLT